MSDDMTNLFLDRASRNGRTIRWLLDQPDDTIWDVRCLYAGHIGLYDVGETLNPLTDVLDDDMLVWVYCCFAHQIDRA